MQVIDLTNTIKIQIDKQILDIDKTFSCGQCFRWNKIGDYWYGVINNKLFFIKSIVINDKQYIETTATQDEWDEILYKYFDLDADYNITLPINDIFANKAKKFGEGIRILRQDTWETLISFIISQRNNIPRIKTTIEKLCKTFGNKLDIRDKNGNTYNKEFYGFPSIEKISKLNINDMLDLGLGYRSEYIIKVAKDVYEGSIDINTINTLSDDEVIARLLDIKGVGPKVANCVALFGLHRLDMFPIDVWIQRVIDRYYDGHIDISRYRPLSGLIQQYMFYYIKYSD